MNKVSVLILSLLVIGCRSVPMERDEGAGEDNSEEPIVEERIVEKLSVEETKDVIKEVPEEAKNEYEEKPKLQEKELKEEEPKVYEKKEEEKVEPKFYEKKEKEKKEQNERDKKLIEKLKPEKKKDGEVEDELRSARTDDGPLGFLGTFSNMWRTASGFVTSFGQMQRLLQTFSSFTG